MTKEIPMILFDLNPDVDHLLADPERADHAAVDRWSGPGSGLDRSVVAGRSVAARACQSVGVRFLRMASALMVEERSVPGPATR
jgi:hypothetical protein